MRVLDAKRSVLDSFRCSEAVLHAFGEPVIFSACSNRFSGGRTEGERALGRVLKEPCPDRRCSCQRTDAKATHHAVSPQTSPSDLRSPTYVAPSTRTCTRSFLRVLCADAHFLRSCAPRYSQLLVFTAPREGAPTKSFVHAGALPTHRSARESERGRGSFRNGTKESGLLRKIGRLQLLSPRGHTLSLLQGAFSK